MANSPESDQLWLQAKNYWAGRTGRELPPTPTVRVVDGNERLGRYMDPYGCQILMNGSKLQWRDFYTWFFLATGGLALTAVIDFWFIFVTLPLLGTWYFWNKAKWRRQYDMYYGVQQRILQAGEPQWVPYDRRRLKSIERSPEAIRP
jgi:hypothetical protein